MTTLFSISTDAFDLHWRLVPGDTASRDQLWEDRPGRLEVRARSAARVTVNRHAPPHLDLSQEPSVTTLGPRLEEETTYHVYVHPRTSEPIRLAHEDPVLLSNIDTEDDGTVHGIVNFRSDVGTSQFTVLVADKPQVDFTVEVFPTKLDYETDYRALVAEVQDLATGLALDYLRSTYQFGHAFRGRQSAAVEWTLLLRHVIDDLEKALRHVAQRPRRSLRREQQLVRPERIRRASRATQSSIRRGAGSGPLTRMKNGTPVRSRIWSRPAEPTLNTPEHRWLASRTRRIRRRLNRLEDALRTGESVEDLPQRRRAAARDLAGFARRVGRLERLEPLLAAEGEPPPGFASQQLLGAPGYREAYQACVLLDAGLRLDGRAIRTSTKALHELYEYWCYLTVIRLISQHTDTPIDPAELFTLRPHGLRLDLQRGEESRVVMRTSVHEITVRYNPIFRADPILVPQQPDIVISFTQESGPEVHLVLDAKYRRDTSDSYIRKHAGVGPPEDAINGMHRYRDAILYASDAHARPRRVVVEAAAVFPHRDSDTTCHRDSRNWLLLRRMGVGAIPALPDATEYLSEWIVDAMRQGGWSLGDRAVRHAAAEQVEHWKETARQPVIIVEADQRELSLDAPSVQITQIWRDREFQMRAEWVAFAVSSEGLRRMVGYRPVTHLSIAASGEPESDQLRVTYDLGRFTPCEIPADESMQTPPDWTSKLALDRAKSLPDLYARTAAEWRLREHLLSRDLSPQIEAPSSDAEHPWLLVAEGRVRYAAATGFEVQDRHGRRYETGRIEDAVELLDRD